MKYFSRLKLYKAASCTFDPTTCDAFSYRWWRFVARVDGLVIFNSYRYSVSTSKHQRKVRGILHDLGIKIDVYLQLPRGIRHGQTLAEMFVEAEETACDLFLAEESKRIGRNEKAAVRRAEKQAKLDAEFKANVEKITYADVIELRASAEVES